MSAGIAALSFLKENKEEVYPFLHEQGNRFAREINDFCETHNIPAKLMNAGSMMHLLFGREKLIPLETSTIASERLSKNSIYTFWGTM